MQVAILGFGKQGRSAYEYWSGQGHDVTVCDQNESLELPEDVKSQLGRAHLQHLDKFNLIVRSPVVHPAAIAAANSPEILKKVTTVTNEFFKVCPTKNIIGVTGTKGKGTTSTLIAKMLEAAGKRVHLGGNIGIPPLDLLKDGIQPDDWVVLELANFQLIDLHYSPYIAVCLMVVDEHLDWHIDTDEYTKAKQQLFAHQTAKDIAIYYAKNERSKLIASAGKAKKIPFMHTPGATVEKGVIGIGSHAIAKTKDVKLLGEHNLQNVCAAITAVWQVTKDVDAVRSVLASFKGLQHRLEFVREVGGVKYYDDSFGTTPETAMVAIKAFPGPKVLILGGSDKGAEFDTLAKTVVGDNVRSIVLIGQTKHNIERALKKAGYTHIVDGGNDMASIVHAAHDQAVIGDIVLLSTACASFDMFRNYEDRAEKFTSAVQALA